MTRVVCLGVLVVSLLELGGCTTKQSYVAKGNKLFAEGKYPDAALNYRAAIQKDAAYGEAYYRLGLLAVKLDQAQDAYDALLRAVQLSPANADAKRKLADVCLSLYLADPGHSQRLYTQINGFADAFLAQDRNSYEGLKLKGYLASTDRNPKEAIANFRRAFAVNSSDAGVITQLAHLLIDDGQVLEGTQLAANLIAQKSSYGPAYDLMYNFFLKANRPAEAENILIAKINNNRKNADYVLELARHYHRANNTAAMAATLQHLLDNPKAFPQARLWVGDFYFGLRDYAEAIGHYQQGANATEDPNMKGVYQARNVLVLLSEEKKEDALRLAQQFHRENPKNAEVLRLNADLLLGTGKPEYAAALVRDFQTLLTQNPRDVSLRMQLGRAYRLNGDLNNARAEFLELIQRGHDLAAPRYELADIAMAQHQPKAAREQASSILSLQPNDRRARLLYASGLLGTGDFETARGVLARLIKDYPQDAEPQVQMGFLALAEKQYPAAVEILNRYRSTGDARIFGALARAYLSQKQSDQARSILNEGLNKWPNSSGLMEQLAATEALSGHYDLALAQYQKLLAANPNSSLLRRRLAEVCDLAGYPSRALVYYQQAHQFAPEDAALTVALADATARTGRIDEAKLLYQAVAKAQPENAPALNNVAFFLADNGGDLDEALRLAKNALAKVPGQPSFSDTIGYIYLKKGMLDSAIQSFTTLAQRYPASASFRYHLGLALFQKGEKADARTELQAALADHPSPQETLRIRELLNDIG
jgi:predicted Zn-dependent protease